VSCVIVVVIIADRLTETSILVRIIVS